MKKISIDEIKQDFSTFLQLIEEGEEFIITQGNHRLAEVTPFEKLPGKPRPIGLGEGDFVVPDDIVDPLPAEFWTGTERK